MKGNRPDIFKHWNFVGKEKIQREYKGHVLTVISKYKPTSFFNDIESDNEIWKWTIEKNNTMIMDGYEESQEEACQNAEFATRELNHENKQ
jgi:hypothetical protein